MCSQSHKTTPSFHFQKSLGDLHQFIRANGLDRKMKRESPVGTSSLSMKFPLARITGTCSTD
jgi:hypothetical protein